MAFYYNPLTVRNPYGSYLTGSTLLDSLSMLSLEDKTRGKERRPAKQEKITVEIDTGNGYPYGQYNYGQYNYGQYNPFGGRRYGHEETVCYTDGKNVICMTCRNCGRKENKCDCGCSKKSDGCKSNPNKASECSKCKEILARPADWVSPKVPAGTGVIAVAVTDNVDMAAQAVLTALIGARAVHLVDGPRAPEAMYPMINPFTVRPPVNLGQTAVVYGDNCPYQGDHFKAAELRRRAEEILQLNHPGLYQAGVRVRQILRMGSATTSHCDNKHPKPEVRHFAAQPHIASYCLAVDRAAPVANTWYVAECSTVNETVSKIVQYVADPLNTNPATRCVVVGPSLFDAPSRNQIIAQADATLSRNWGILVDPESGADVGMKFSPEGWALPATPMDAALHLDTTYNPSYMLARLRSRSILDDGRYSLEYVYDPRAGFGYRRI